ncbi:hypothetical protein JCM9279_000935 [Rhodotorula babjevae]
MSTAAPSTTPTATTATSSASPTTTYGYPYWGGSSGFSSTWVTWVSVVVVAGVLVALLCSRYFYIRRFYHRPTFRAYFVPDKGIHVKWLGIHIAGPPHRIPREPPPSYAATARRRRRRGRQTAGETVAEGGRRIGACDDDDGWDDLDMVERGGAGGLVPAVPATLDELPRYYVDSGLPGYFGGEGDAADEAERIRAEAAAAGESSVIPSAAEYEAAIRASRDPAAATAAGSTAAGASSSAGDQHPPAYPPAAHLSAPTASDVPARPARPTLPGRSSTARSALILSAFRRAPSPAPDAIAASADGPPHALGAPASSSSSSTTFDSAPSSPRTRPAHLERTPSTESASSASTKLGKSAAASSSSVRGKRSLALDGEDDEGDASTDASSSRVNLDGGDKAQHREGGKGGDA